MPATRRPAEATPIPTLPTSWRVHRVLRDDPGNELRLDVTQETGVPGEEVAAIGVARPPVPLSGDVSSSRCPIQVGAVPGGQAQRPVGERVGGADSLAHLMTRGRP